MQTETTYQHTQRAPLCLSIYAVAAVMLVLSWALQEVPAMTWLFLITGSVVFVLAMSFHHLTIEDEGQRLAIRFGPLPVFQRRVAYDQITSASAGRTTILDGWGIHLSLRGGWVWNIWGRDCVVLQLRNSTLRVGTDDAENLAAFVRSRIEPETP